MIDTLATFFVSLLIIAAGFACLVTILWLLDARQQ